LLEAVQGSGSLVWKIWDEIWSSTDAATSFSRAVLPKHLVVLDQSILRKHAPNFPIMTASGDSRFHELSPDARFEKIVDLELCGLLAFPSRMSAKCLAVASAACSVFRL
jgi:hypothetical protein